MDDVGLLKVRRNWVYLNANLVADDLAPHLFQDISITEEDLEKIKAESTPQAKASRLLLIMKCKDGGYQKLCKGLRATQPFIVNILEGNTGDDTITSRLLETFSECLGASVKVGDIKEALNHTFGPHFGDNDLFQKVKSAFPTANVDLQTFEIKNIQKRRPDPDLRFEADAHGPTVQSLQLISVEDLCTVLKDKIKSEKVLKLSLIQIFIKHNISGRVFFHMTPEEFEKLQPEISFGERKTLFLIRDQMIREETIQRKQTTHDCGKLAKPTPGRETNSEDNDCAFVSIESTSANQTAVHDSETITGSKTFKRRKISSKDSNVLETSNLKKSFSYPSIMSYFPKIRK